VKVVHISYSDANSGGAIAAYRLHRGLRGLGVDSTMFVSGRRTNDATVVEFHPAGDVASRVRRRFRHLQMRAFYKNSAQTAYGWVNHGRSVHGADAVAQLPASEVIHMHAPGGLIDFNAFFRTVPQRIPIVKTLHDMSFFTGGCQCDQGCGKYTKDCGACPQLGSNRERDLSRDVWELKKAALAAVPPGRLHVVAPSRWLANEARRSSLLQRFPVSVIPLGLDLDVFAPRSREFGRELLGIPQDASVVMCIAEPITWETKGFALLAQALNQLRHLPNLFLVSVGSGKPPAEVGIPHLHLGHVGHERLVSLVYNTADVFVIPSWQENFPQTALEAVACGIPAIGFEVGGIPDIIRPDITGLLVPLKDVAALAAAIAELLRDPDRRARIAANCRRIAMQEYTLELQAQRYVDLYRSVLAS
jgi:glycosyltransferase involved in cell wall biosynthesis